MFFLVKKIKLKKVYCMISILIIQPLNNLINTYILVGISEYNYVHFFLYFIQNLNLRFLLNI